MPSAIQQGMTRHLLHASLMAITCYSQVHASVVSTLLSLMDGMEDRGMVLVVGATNRWVGRCGADQRDCSMWLFPT